MGGGGGGGGGARDVFVFRAWQGSRHLLLVPLMTVQMDVIEAQYTQLGEALSKAQDFKEAQRAHEGFLTALMDTSLLDIPLFVAHLVCVL